MRNILFFGIIIIMAFTLFSCSYFSDKTFISNEKNFEFINSEYTANIIIVDKNNKQYEKIIDPKRYHGWTKDFIGDFRFIFIKTGNDIEGIFIINNKYKKKIFSFDIISKEEYAEKINNNIIDPYRITIEIIDNIFEIRYDNTKYNISSYFSYNENYSSNKEKYMIDTQR